MSFRRVLLSARRTLYRAHRSHTPAGRWIDARLASDPRVYFSQHFGCEFPESLRALGFSDASYGNDAAARAVLTAPCGCVVNVWCAEQDPRDRENTGLDRFAVSICREEDMCEPEEILGTTEDVGALHDMVTEAINDHLMSHLVL